MSVILYIARVSGDEARGYTAVLPDLPSVSAAAASTPSLLRELRERLLQELKRLEAEGVDWPASSPMERLRDDPSGADSLLMLVDVQVDDAPVRVNISSGERLLKRSDDAAETQNMSRAGFIPAAARQRLGDELGAKPAPDDSASQRLYEEILAVGRRVTETLGPDSTLGRAIAELDSRALEGLRMMGSIVGRPRKE